MGYPTDLTDQEWDVVAPYLTSQARPGETPKEAAKRIMDEQYDPGNWKEGTSTEYNQIKKHLERTKDE